MKDAKAARRRYLLLAAAAAVAAWGIVGIVQRPSLGWGGYVYSPRYVVDGVEPGGPAETAGLRTGDRVVSVAGIPVETLPLYSRWPRSLAPRPGETLRIVVERSGETLPIDIVYNARSMGALQWGGVAIGLAFMVFGLWALFAAQTAQALALAHVGLAAGLATLGGGGPYLGTWEGVASHIQFAGTVLWGLLLLRFFLVFPNPKPVAASRLAIGAMYGAWGLFVGCMVLELIAHPALYHTFGPFGSLLTALCVILALIAIFHTVLKTSGRELWESGMGLILVGLLVAAVPTLVGTAAFMLGLDLPGARFYPLMLVALPFTMALAVMKHARRA